MIPITEDDFLRQKAAEKEEATFEKANEAIMVKAGKWKYPEVPDNKQMEKAEAALLEAGRMVAAKCVAPRCSVCNYRKGPYNLIDGRSACSLASAYTETKRRLCEDRAALEEHKRQILSDREKLEEIKAGQIAQLEGFISDAEQVCEKLTAEIPELEAKLKEAAKVYSVSI